MNLKNCIDSFYIKLNEVETFFINNQTKLEKNNK